MSKINLETLDFYIKSKRVKAAKHPELPISILNYTKETQFSQAWDEFTMMSRALVIDEEGSIVGRSFPKFFNWEEVGSPEFPNEDYKVYEKMDGSLGLLFYYKDQWVASSRGSFISDQSEEFRNMLKNYDLSSLDKTHSYSFEIIYPTNRIVIDYKFSDVTLLGIFVTETGEDLSLEDAIVPFRKAKLYDGSDCGSIMDLKNLDAQNREGFVIQRVDGSRFKVKFKNYVVKHRLMSQINDKYIWKILSRGDRFNEDDLSILPDEYYDWLKSRLAYYRDEYKLIESEHVKLFKKLSLTGMSDKDFAISAKKNKGELNISIIFGLRRNKDYSKAIWRILEPKSEEKVAFSPL